MKQTYIDPPQGWKYGFPKVLPKGVDDVRLWLVRNGYPIKLMESWGEHFYCRLWEEEDED